MTPGSSKSPTRLQFATFELDIQSGELRKAGILVGLPPQPFKVLALLASRGGQLVTREEIQREVWGEDTVVDFERGLNFAINRIRAVLGDSADAPRFVQTLPRRGYRFLYPVELKNDRDDTNLDGAPAPAPGANFAPPPAERPAPDLPAPQRRDRRWLVWAAGIVLAVVIATSGWLRRPTPTPTPRPVMRWTVVLPGARSSPWLNFSPDGAHLAYVGASRQIIVRSLDRNETKTVQGVADIGEPLFSPDGQWILYLENTSLKKVPAGGGPSITIASVPSSWYGIAWADDGTILIGQGAGGLLRVIPSGGAPTALTTVDGRRGELSHAWPWALPGSRAALFTINHGSYDDSEIAVLDLRTGKYRVLFKGGAHAVYVPTGHLVYFRGGSLFGVPFDLSRLAVQGSAVPVLDHVASVPWAGFADFTFSQTGVLAYAQTLERNDRRLVWVDRKGSVTPLPAPAREYVRVSLAPDERRLALEISEALSAIWTYDLRNGALTQLTFLTSLGSYWSPVWKPDGNRLAYVREPPSGSQVIQSIPPDGGTPPSDIVDGQPGVARDLGGWSPDGKTIVFTTQMPGGKYDIYTVADDAPAGNRTPRPLIRSSGDKSSPRVSPNGRWIAYCSDEDGGPEIIVQPFPETAGIKWRISPESGTEPRWSPTGREIFYRDGGKLMAVDVESGPGFHYGKPRVLFEGRFERSYEVGKNGERFLMIQRMDEGTQPHAEVVMEWFEELKRLAPRAK